MKMKRIVSIIFALVLTATFSYQLEAQTFGAPEYMKGKLVLGGNADLGFAGNCFYVGVAPQAGYRLTRSLEVGARIGYDLQYYWDYYGNYYYHYFAGALYANYEIFGGIYAEVEDEEMCCLFSGTNQGPVATQWSNNVFVGGGYRQYYDATSYFYYSILYNLSWDYSYNSFTPYASPFVIRVGFCKGF